MSRFFIFIVLCFFTFSFASGQSPAGHDVRVHLKDYHGGKLYLGNYYGQQTYLIDSAEMDDRGTAIFKGKDTLEGGIYFILLPEKQRYFELLIDKDQHFSVTADTTGGFKNIVFTNSPGNVLFSEYNHFLRKEQEKTAEAEKRGDDSAVINQLQQNAGKEIQEYRIKFLQEHPEALLSMIFRAMQDPELPAHLKDAKDSTDKALAFDYFRKHYWDHIAFADNRIVRTPVLATRLQRYFTQMVVPVPDSINKAADKILSKANANKEVFKYVLWWLTYHYETSPYMGMDAVFVHLVEKYYITGQAYWLTKDQLQKVIDRASQIAPNLIGNIAPDLSLKTREMKPVSLWNVKSKYTILVFWDPTCGHCQVVVPELDSAYEHHWKNEGVKMIGVMAGGTQDQWQRFIKDHHMEDWVNAWDPDNSTNYRRLYDVYMTPVVYLLDKNKKILAKQLDVQQMNDFLNHLNSKETDLAKKGE
jgi:peroxiredoxin